MHCACCTNLATAYCLVWLVGVRGWCLCCWLPGGGVEQGGCSQHGECAAGGGITASNQQVAVFILLKICTSSDYVRLLPLVQSEAHAQISAVQAVQIMAAPCVLLISRPNY
jgi:hypothetical protein